MSRSIIRGAVAAVATGALLLVAVVPAAQAALPASQTNYLVDGATRQGAYDGNISDDGTKVLFRADPDNYPQFSIPTNLSWYHFVRDVVTDDIQAVGVVGGVVPTNGTYNASISGNGQYVTYWSDSFNLGGTNVAQVYRWDIQNQTNTVVSADTGGGTGDLQSGDPAIRASPPTDGMCRSSPARPT